MILAHPVDQPGGLPFSSLAAAGIGMCAVVAVALSPAKTEATPAQASPPYSWTGGLSGAAVAGRLVTSLLLVMAVLAGRTGSESELENLAPALVIGTAWPLLVAASLVFGSAWRAIDPWDGIARVLEPGSAGEAEAAGDVRAAIPIAIGWGWYLSAYPNTLHPRAAAAALALYTIVTLAGCQALGRTAWLSHVEAFGLFLAWTGSVRGKRILSWRPPRGAAALLGALAGGALFAPVKTSSVYASLGPKAYSAPYLLGGVLVACALGALVVALLERTARRLGAPGSVVASAVPAVATLVLALGMARNRLFTSLQLLPGLLGDPFGWGWDLLGEAGRALDPNPLGTTGRIVAQALVVLGGSLVGAWVAARRTGAGRRAPCIAVLGTLLTAGAFAITAP